MNHAKAIVFYDHLTKRPDLVAAIREIEDDELRDLNSWLEMLNIGGGVPALIHGLVQVEAARRFMEGGAK